MDSSIVWYCSKLNIKSKIVHMSENFSGEPVFLVRENQYRKIATFQTVKSSAFVLAASK